MFGSKSVVNTPYGSMYCEIPDCPYCKEIVQKSHPTLDDVVVPADDLIEIYRMLAHEVAITGSNRSGMGPSATMPDEKVNKIVNTMHGNMEILNQEEEKQIGYVGADYEIRKPKCTLSPYLKKFAEGSVVHHRRNPSHAMSVESINEGSRTARCCWFKGTLLKRESFFLHELELHQASSSDHNSLAAEEQKQVGYVGASAKRTEDFTYFTFVAILKNGRHIHHTGVALGIELANKQLHSTVRKMLRGEIIKRFWYMLGDGHEAQEYLPEEVEEVFGL